MKKRCRAENAECRLETGESIFQGSLKFLRCELCCMEPGFCRECICLLCCKALKSSLEENFTIRCLQRISKAGICGHAVHLSCALDSQMAGVVKLYGIDMEYLCRRCDQKTDLKDVIVHLVGGMARVNAKPYAEKMLKLALRTIRGSERGGHETKMLERALHWALDKTIKGEDVQTLLEPGADGSDSKSGDDRQHQTKESLGYLPPCSSSPVQVSAVPSGSIASTPIIVSSAPCMTVESNAAELGQDFRQEDNLMVEQDTPYPSKSLEFDRNGHAVTEADAIIENLSTKTLVQPAEINGTSIAISLIEKAQAEAELFSITRKEPIIRTALGSKLMTNGIVTGHEELEDNGPIILDFTIDSSLNQAATPVTDSYKAVSAYDAPPIIRRGENNSLLDADEGLNSLDCETYQVAVEAPGHAPEIFNLPSKLLLDSQYERHIQDALQKLKNRQVEKYSLTKQCLVAKKKEVMDRFHQLNLARRILATQAPSMSKEEVSTLLENIVSQAACLEKERVLLEELLQTCKIPD